MSCICTNWNCIWQRMRFCTEFFAFAKNWGCVFQEVKKVKCKNTTKRFFQMQFRKQRFCIFSVKRTLNANYSSAKMHSLLAAPCQHYNTNGKNKFQILFSFLDSLFLSKFQNELMPLLSLFLQRWLKFHNCFRKLVERFFRFKLEKLLWFFFDRNSIWILTSVFNQQVAIAMIAVQSPDSSFLKSRRLKNLH